MHMGNPSLDNSTELRQGILSCFATKLGLGEGDCVGLPVQAKADLMIRAPHLGWHKREKVKLDDLFNHIDLFTYILLRLDGASLRWAEDEGHLYPSQPVDKPLGR